MRTSWDVARPTELTDRRTRRKNKNSHGYCLDQRVKSKALPPPGGSGRYKEARGEHGISVDNSAPSPTGLSSTYKLGKSVQTKGATSESPRPRCPPSLDTQTLGHCLGEACFCFFPQVPKLGNNCHQVRMGRIEGTGLALLLALLSLDRA